MFYRCNFLTSQSKKGRLEGEEEAGKKVQGGRDEVEICDSVTQNVQCDVICQMISLFIYLIKLLEFSEVWSKSRRKKSRRRQGRKGRGSRDQRGREKGKRGMSGGSEG